MHTLEELKVMTISKLKELAAKENIYFNKTVKKEELIQLLLNPGQKNETRKAKADKEKIKTVKVKSTGKKTGKEEEINIVDKKINIDEIPDLPKTYGKNKIVLMIRDPYNGFAYWDTNGELVKKHDLDNGTVNKYLKVYDITDSGNIENSSFSFDVLIDYRDNSRYINFPRPNRKYIVVLGYYKQNKFVSIMKSNEIELPRIEVSDNYESADKDNFLNDRQFELIMQSSGANVMFQHDGSQELMKFLSGNIESNVSSGKR